LSPIRVIRLPLLEEKGSRFLLRQMLAEKREKEHPTEFSVKVNTPLVAVGAP
jgi:3,4-dihydroxy-2-butanone 4-phosphate synthase